MTGGPPEGPIVVVAEIELVGGREPQGLAAIERVCAQTHAHDRGCLLYAAHADPDHPTRLTMVEKWESAAALAAHRESPHSHEFATVEAIAAVRRVTLLRPLGFGDPELGAL